MSTSPPTSSRPNPDRAILFVDGNNFYHGLKTAGVHNQGQLDFAKIARKVLGPRQWDGLRYYVGQVRQTEDHLLYAQQRAFMARQRGLDGRISFHMGRLEHKPAKDGCASELADYLSRLHVTIDATVRAALVDIAKRHKGTVIVEKAVDVMLAVDLVILAERNEYDTAYVLSADGDYTHAVTFVRSKGKRVFALSAQSGAQLAAVVDTFIRIDAAWVKDCYI
jgi:uncharacterized LabA/DUF88 family protein